MLNEKGRIGDSFFPHVVQLQFLSFLSITYLVLQENKISNRFIIHILDEITILTEEEK